MTFASGLSKAELHLHIEGTLEPEMVFRLARRNGVGLSYPDAASLARAYRFSDLQSFLTLYYAGMDVLRTSEDFYELADAYLRRAQSDGVRHAEIFFDPQAHLSRGIPLRDVVRGLSTAADQSTERYGISVLLIACFLRDRSAREAMDTLEALAEHADEIHAVGLDSAEVGHPPSDFQDVFEAAASLGFRRVAHAGEEGPPEFIWQALDLLGAERIDHGIRAVEDRELLRRLAVDRVPLTVCPLSNVRLRCIDTIARHPLPALLDHGVLVSINSDDPAYFGGYIGANYEVIQAAFDLTDADLASVAANSFRSSFLPAQVISAHLASSRP
jgi:adenosine deaminase